MHTLYRATISPSVLCLQVFSTKAIQAEYATTLTDVQKIETTAGQRNDKLEFVEAPGSSASPNEFVLDQVT